MNDRSIRIRKANTKDLKAVLQLLQGAGLPSEGVVDGFGHFLVATGQCQMVGVVGLEHHGNAVLLRSLAVAPECRSRGLGSRLLRAALDQAKDTGACQVYLLTTTAASFFPRLGFQLVDRGKVTGVVTSSVEWTSACPQTAVCMKLELGKPGMN